MLFFSTGNSGSAYRALPEADNPLLCAKSSYSQEGIAVAPLERNTFWDQMQVTTGEAQL